MTLQRALFTDIFDRGLTVELDVEQERWLLADAQAGDAAATETLVRAYAPALRHGLKSWERAQGSLPQRSDVEDMQAEAVLAVMEAIHAFDPEKHRRLAAIAPEYVREAVSSAAGSATTFTIPERTLKRFFGILRAAEGDTTRALELAPSYEMKRETFLAVLDSIRNTDSYDALAAAGEDGEGGGRDLAAQPVYANREIVDADHRILAETALRAIDDGLESQVVALAYGFADYDPQSDYEIADRIGHTRSKVQRVRGGALTKMRSALGVA